MTRIRTVAATLVAASLSTAGLALARTEPQAPSAPSDLAFEIRRDGSSIGTHRVSFRREGDSLHVTVDIRIEVGFAMFTLFRYRHENREVWRDGRLVAIDTWTEDDGTNYRVRGRATAEGFAVEGPSGTFTAPADVLPTSYWHPGTPGREQLLDTQNGRLVRVETRPAAGDASTAERRYRMRGDLDLELRYDRAGRWLGVAFRARGSDIDYVPQSRGTALADTERPQ